VPNSDGHSFAEEKTEVLYDPNEIVRRAVEEYHTLKHTVDVCTDLNGPSIFVIPNHPVTEAYVDMKNRGVRMRFISEITNENIQYCKELMKVVTELRHLDEVKGNFGVADKRVYHASATTIKSAPPPQLIISTVKAVVDQQQYFFDMLWKKAIPAKQRIKEIEQGVKREFMDTIQDPYEIQKILDSLLKSATEEILIILPTTSTTNKRLYQYEQENLLQLLRNAAEHRVKIRILADLSTKEIIERELLFTKSNSDLVELQFLDKEQQNKVITIIADKELCLTTEVKDNEDDIDSTVEVLGLATYSNSESTVLSYASIFETLWIQAELKNKQKKVESIS
jgi:two-component system, OmpR family, sensor histidine kinase VicK